MSGHPGLPDADDAGARLRSRAADRSGGEVFWAPVEDAGSEVVHLGPGLRDRMVPKKGCRESMGACAVDPNRTSERDLRSVARPTIDELECRPVRPGDDSGGFGAVRDGPLAPVRRRTLRGVPCAWRPELDLKRLRRRRGGETRTRQAHAPSSLLLPGEAQCARCRSLRRRWDGARRTWDGARRTPTGRRRKVRESDKGEAENGPAEKGIGHRRRALRS